MIRDALYNMANDTGNIKRNAAVQIIIATVAFVLLVRIFPLGLVQSYSYSRQQAYSSSQKAGITGEAFTSSDKKLQTVFFSESHLYSVKLYMACDTQETESRADTVLFRIYDESFSCIYEEECCIGDIEDSGYLKATPDIDVEQDKAYYYEMIIPEECEANFKVPVADVSLLAQSENGVLYIDGIYNDSVALIADFCYSSRLSVLGVIFRYVLILALAAAVYIGAAVLLYLYDTRCREKTKVWLVLRVAASAVAVCFALFLIAFSVVLNKFGGGTADRICFLIAIIVGLAWLMLAIWIGYKYPRYKQLTKLSAGRNLSLAWRNYIQTVCFGLLFYALCCYVNADRELYHYTNTRRMLICLAIALLMMYTEKQFTNKFSAIWLVLALIGSVIYCRGFEQGTNERLLAELACGVIAAWGLLILNMALQLAQTLKDKEKRKTFLKKPKPLELIYGILWIVFSIFMYVYRFEKVWVFTATLPFLAIFLMRLTPAAKSRLLKNLVNGILLSFALTTLYCFAHRPYHYWRYYRYNGFFHTVACTGMYLAVVFGAAFAKLLGKLKNKGRMLINCPLECFVAAAAAGYIFLTMSRTAILAVVFTVLLTAALAAFSFHKTAAAAIKELAQLLVVVVLCIPLVFAAVRMIPAVVNDPVRFDVEDQDKGYMIYKGDPIDSDKYMTVEWFFSVFLGRYKTDGEDEALGILQGSEDEYLAYTGDAALGKVLIPVADDDDDEDDESSEKDSFSNGRLDIFRDYVGALELAGHEKMGFVNDEGRELEHAHNSYLQIAYNFGIIAGVVFIVICAVSLWSAAGLVLAQGEKFGIYLVPFALIVVFGIVSITEWAFHPCIPAGFCFLFVQPLLINKKENRL